MSSPRRQRPTQESFPFEARLAWMSIAPDAQTAILEHVWCTHCSAGTPMTMLGGQLKSGGLLLSGKCSRCGGDTARFIEELPRRDPR